MNWCDVLWCLDAGWRETPGGAWWASGWIKDQPSGLCVGREKEAAGESPTWTDDILLLIIAPPPSKRNFGQGKDAEGL